MKRYHENITWILIIYIDTTLCMKYIYVAVELTETNWQVDELIIYVNNHQLLDRRYPNIRDIILDKGRRKMVQELRSIFIHWRCWYPSFHFCFRWRPTLFFVNLYHTTLHCILYTKPILLEYYRNTLCSTCDSIRFSEPLLS